MNEIWLCESLRLSALWGTTEIPKDSAKLSWENVVGTAPDESESKPKLGIVKDSGIVAGRNLVLSRVVAPGRVDWIASPEPQHLVVGKLVPNIGDTDSAYQDFQQILFEKTAEVYNAPRFALGLTAVKMTAGKQESYAKITQYLKRSQLDITGASDFVFQINRPRKPVTGIADPAINRLSKWQSIMIAPIAIILNTTLKTAQSTDLNREPIHAIRVELDINNSGEGLSLFSNIERLSLLTEFGKLASEILREGDIP